MRDWLITQDGLVAELARDELDDIIRINAVILGLRRRIERTVRPVAPNLIVLQGCGELTAARIIAEVANIERFRSEAAFARYAGLARSRTPPALRACGCARPATATAASTPRSTAPQGRRHLRGTERNSR
ncbi:MAG: transposase [Actinomycetota bacterium]|nr:transposase [Actinomycetota bacterium]MDA2951052.1 transposase [Actinomycetota bacterium]